MLALFRTYGLTAFLAAGIFYFGFHMLTGERGFTGDYRGMEWAGACFSEDGKWLFVNIQTPGITGRWQVSAREHHDFEEMLDLDLEYLENISFMNDCRILLATVPAVLRARGSH